MSAKPPDGEPKQENEAPAPTKADLPFPLPSAPSLSSSDETPLTTGRALFETPLDLCVYLAEEGTECLADFDWLVSEATRLVEENQ